MKDMISDGLKAERLGVKKIQKWDGRKIELEIFLEDFTSDGTK